MDSLQGLLRPETYTIGFTVNQYSSTENENLSPSPTDHLLGYNSHALDYAERTNKGAENIFLDRSLSIDRERQRTVGRINNGILEIVFELTERRKTPFPNRTRKEEFVRCDSELSNCTIVSLRSSSSDPTLQVKQFSPRELQIKQFSPREQCEKFPRISLNEHVVSDKKKEKQQNRENSKRGQNDEQKSGKHVDNLPKLEGTFDKLILQNKSKKDEEQQSTTDQRQAKAGFTTEETSKATCHNFTGGGKWKIITQRLVEANKLVREGSLELDRYKGRYLTPEYDRGRRQLSFCQSSYRERSERERIDNIRRRHVSQARTGPLDFNKLRRQITTGRSNSFVH